MKDEFTKTLPAVRVTPAMLLALRALAKAEDRPISWLVRKAITDLLEKH